MLLSEVLTDINDRYPNTSSESQKIRWINNSIYEVYRYIAVDGKTDITTTADLAIYEFPAGVIPENINAMTISLTTESADDNLFLQRHLRPLGLNDPLRYNGWAKVNEETFMVYPTPITTGQVIRIYYQVQPPEYTTDDTAEDLTDYLRRDYLQAIIFRTIVTLCEITDDITKANNFTRRYNDELQRLKSEKWNKNGKFPRTIDVSKSLGKNRRYNRVNSKLNYYSSEGS